VITMDMIGRIRRLHSRGKKSEREIARMTGLSRNTVAKWLRGHVGEAPTYRRGPMPSKLKAFEDAIKQALQLDARRPKHERRTARALYVQIKAAGYDGGYSRVTDFIRAWRQGEGAGAVTRAFVPLSFELGEAFQFDWSEEGLVVGGIYYRLQVAHMKLCASRAFWLVAYPSQGHEMLFDAHTRGFAALGGVPRRGIYDNMKTAVDQAKKGKGRVVNARFSSLCAHYLFDADFCNVASGWEKGVVEKNVQDSRRRIWIDASKERFANFAELNAWLAGGAPPRAQQLQRGRDAGARALSPDAHACALRRLRGAACAGQQHVSGHRSAQPLLGALRTGWTAGQHPAVPRRGGGGGRRQGRGPPRAPEHSRRDEVRLAALHPAHPEEARCAEKRRAVRRPARALAAVAPGAVA
jgi:transposase